MNFFILTCFLLMFLFQCDKIHCKQVELATSCNNLKDGLYYIKPSSEGEVIPVYCNNGYTVINLALNKESVSSYFTSFYQYHWNYDGIYGGDCDFDSEHSSWREWWMPATSDTKFQVAADCMSCEESLSYKDNTGYYMTNYYFCANKQKKSSCEYDSDQVSSMDDLAYDVDSREISMCNICDNPDLEGGMWTDCVALQLDADITTSSNHDDCVDGGKLIVKPSTTGNSEYCTCYQQSSTDDDDDDYFVIDTDVTSLPKVSILNYQDYQDLGVYIDSLIIWDDTSTVEEDDTVEDEDCATKKHYLREKDFKTGTYRIQECGEYILTQDIEIHFNKPNEDNMNDVDWSPNDYSYDNLAWYPSTLQQEGENGYEGPDAMRGTYQTGFFAGITVECDDVIINLNNYQISMDYVYYVQQRVFSLITLANRPFVELQGPGDYGRQEFISVSNIIIKDGTLGRTSHHGIFGHDSDNVLISNVNIKSFDVAGIACNGCRSLEISDCVIGPQNNDIPVSGKYSHGRALLPRLRYLVENYGDNEVIFGGSGSNAGISVTIEDLADEFVTQLDMVYNYVINNIDYDDDTYDDDDVDMETWVKAKEMFINEDGYNDGGSSYGIFLNGIGTGVACFGFRQSRTEDITLTNVEIFGIHNKPYEMFWSEVDSTKLTGFFLDPLDWENIMDSEHNNLYNGDAYHDLVFATQLVANKDEFCLFNTLYTSPLLDWVFEDDVDVLDQVSFMCGSDIQSHDSKGTMGLRVDGVKGLSLYDVNIHDINNYGNVGSDFCGEYDSIQWIPTIRKEMEPGYTGTLAHGFIIDYADISEIDNLIINNIESQYGSAIGAAIHMGTTVYKMSNIEISNVKAGSLLSENEANELILPNYLPFACSLQLGQDNGEDYITFDNNDDIDLNTINGESIFGFNYCDDDARLGSMSLVSSTPSSSNIIKSKYVNTNNVIIIVIVIGIVVLCGMLLKCVKTIKSNREMSKISQKSKIDEASPLLNTNDTEQVVIV